MTNDYSSPLDDAFQEAEDAGSSIIDRISERLTRNATAKTVFGDPVEREGVTVIPVARVRMGFGGGEGGTTKDNEQHGDSSEAGGGGGGGLMASPIGYIEVRGGQAEFRRLHDPVSYWPLVLVGGISAWLVLRGVRAILRG